MTGEFSELETAVLGWMKTHYDHPILSAQIDSARLIRRNWTGVGVYVDLEVSSGVPPLDPTTFGRKWPIDGPELRSSGIENGGGAILWGEAGFIHCIEMYAYGNRFDEQIYDFELSAV